MTSDEATEYFKLHTDFRHTASWRNIQKSSTDTLIEMAEKSISAQNCYYCFEEYC